MKPADNRSSPSLQGLILDELEVHGVNNLDHLKESYVELLKIFNVYKEANIKMRYE